MSSDRPSASAWAAGILLGLSLAFAGWAWNQNRQAHAETAALTGNPTSAR